VIFTIAGRDVAGLWHLCVLGLQSASAVYSVASPLENEGEVGLMSDQTARTSAEPAASTQRATRQLMIKRIEGGIGPRPDLRSALRDLLAEASTPAEPTVPSQATPQD
jgi:hypothetical protein